MIIGIACDHHGVKLKNEIISYFKENDIKYIDYGSNNPEENVDYIDYALKLCKDINDKNTNLGILICGTGIGMSVVANKIKGIICAKVSNEKEAYLSREHNMANVMAIGEAIENPIEVVKAFISIDPSTEERHIRRNNKIKMIEGGEL